MTLYHSPTLAPVPDGTPLLAEDPAGHPTLAPLDWWQTAYPDTWRALLAAHYAIGIHEDPAPWGLAEPVLETDADGLPIIRRAALPEPVDTRTDAERLADERAGMSCTPLAGELVLARHGLRQGWLALMGGLPEVDQVRYLRAARWDRADPIMDAALAHLMPDLDADARGLALDDLFREAMALDDRE